MQQIQRILFSEFKKKWDKWKWNSQKSLLFNKCTLIKNVGFFFCHCLLIFSFFISILTKTRNALWKHKTKQKQHSRQHKMINSLYKWNKSLITNAYIPTIDSVVLWKKFVVSSLIHSIPALIRHHALTSHFEKYTEWCSNQLPEPLPGVS